MSASEHEEEEEEEEPPKKSNKMVKVPATLASIESLTFPLVHEVVLLADYRCKKCKDRVAGIVSKLNGDMESMEMKIMEKKVIITFTGKHSSRESKSKKMQHQHQHVKKLVKKFSNLTRLLRYSNAR